MGTPKPQFSRDGQSVGRRDVIKLASGIGLVSITGGCSKATAPPAHARPTSAVTVTAAAPSAPTPAGAPPSPAIAPPIPAAATGVMLCRESWGARPARPGGRPHTIDRMTVHHSAVALPDNRQIAARLRQHQRYHQDDKGWVDIAYHVGVDRDGNIFQLRDTAIAGDTATDYDTTGHFLVLCEGNFDEETVTDAQLNGAALAFAWATMEFGIGTDTLASHQEVASATSCPGQSLQAHVTSGDLKRRTDELLASGFELNLSCGPEAAQTVANIEAGR